MNERHEICPKCGEVTAVDSFPIFPKSMTGESADISVVEFCASCGWEQEL